MEKIIGTVPGKCRKKREKARLTLNNNPEISWHMKKSRRTYNGVHLNKKSNTQDVVEQSLTIMPNHVTNRLEINADRETVQKVMNFLKGKTDDDNTPCYIDFNNIIPMPEELLIEKSSSGDLGMKYLEAMQLKPFYFLLDDDALRTIQWIEGLAEKDRKEALQLGASYLENRKKYGYPTWYEWSTATWGTKWNAYHQDFEEPNILWFDTAWNGVPLLIQKLSEIFPDVEFHYAYADEDLGFNTGRGTARNGEINMTIPEGRSNEAFEIMFFVKPGMDEYFELTDEGYKWVS